MHGVDLDTKRAGVDRAYVMEARDRILGTIEPSGYGGDHGGDKEDFLNLKSPAMLHIHVVNLDPKRAHPDRAWNGFLAQWDSDRLNLPRSQNT